CSVPDGWEENPHLAKWVSYQRRCRKTDKLNKERFSLLDELGFVWDTLEGTWQLRFRELEEFKREHGHCDVPGRSREHRLLTTWVQHQRRNWNEGQLSSERAEKLRSLGFLFDPFEQQWSATFE